MLVASHHLEPTVTLYVHRDSQVETITVALTSLQMSVSLSLPPDDARWLARALERAADTEPPEPAA